MGWHHILCLLCFHFFLHYTLRFALPFCPPDQHDALLHFKNSFTNSWDNVVDCCSWDGLTCDGATGNVIGLDLTCSRLHGILQSNSSLFLLRHLRSLNLSGNNFAGSHISPNMSAFAKLTHLNLSYSHFLGTIPSEISRLSKLDTSLRQCGISTNSNFCGLLGIALVGFFSRNMPSCFDNITNLILLDLSGNKLQGPLPQSLVKCMNLSILVLILVISNNNFIGRWPMEFFSNTLSAIIDLSSNNNNMTGKIPSSICNFTKLEIIDLSNNGLTGSLPRCLTNFSTVLSVLNLQMNYLEGTILQSFSSRSSLTTLDFSQNHFEGTLPRSLVKCSHMEVLDLSDNQIEDTFPRWLGTLPGLRVLILRSNNLKGLLNIPRGEHLFLKLHILDISNNNFSSPLSANLIMSLRAILVKILTFLTIIDLSHNSFQGQIPEVIGHLHSLVGLNLSHNHLTGSIPLTLGNLTNLGWLDLSSNKLSGDKQLSTFSSDSFSGNLGLCGTPLPKACLGGAQSPPPSSSSTFDREGHESWFK
ncbi:hypothetical protein EUGRSUZ_F00704 [Eucalyptus grandis]|uniref:Uncharacterized protein n=2 Tax=Eucalyptus grandis TaxID=71139 RepID=A0ACC3KCY1_EUCGR|nr:hypothetical protein EUGRSUZ_F00704 [Eucalyptus grandis]